MANKSYNGLEWDRASNFRWPTSQLEAGARREPNGLELTVTGIPDAQPMRATRPIFGQSAHSVDNTVAEPHHIKASESKADTSADCLCFSNEPVTHKQLANCAAHSSFCATPKGRSESGSSQPSSPPPASLTRSEAIFMLTGMLYGYESSELSFGRFERILGELNGYGDGELITAIEHKFQWHVSIRG